MVVILTLTEDELDAVWQSLLFTVDSIPDAEPTKQIYLEVLRKVNATKHG